MEEPQAGAEERDDGGGPVHLGGERRGRARLVVVLEETGEPVLVVEAREEVLSDGPGGPVLEAVVEPLEEAPAPDG